MVPCELSRHDMFCSRIACVHSRQDVESAISDISKSNVAIWNKLTPDQIAGFGKAMQDVVERHVPEGSGYIREGMYINLENTHGLYFECFNAGVAYLAKISSTDPRGQFVK